jgi:hypothetical protein
MNMPRSLTVFLALATLSATAYAQYQAPPANPAGQQTYPQSQSQYQQRPLITSTQPAEGIWLRTDSGSSVKTVSTNANGTELRIEHGRANVQINHAAPNAQILVDLPGGQVSLLKDGLYTFNADTNTVRVLRGEAETYLDANAKAVKIKEDHQVTFATGAVPKSVEADPQQIASDVLPGGRGSDGGYPGRGYGYGYGPYGDGPYAYPPYPYPYYAYG